MDNFQDFGIFSSFSLSKTVLLSVFLSKIDPLDFHLFTIFIIVSEVDFDCLTQSGLFLEGLEIQILLEPAFRSINGSGGGLLGGGPFRPRHFPAGQLSGLQTFLNN